MPLKRTFRRRRPFRKTAFRAKRKFARRRPMYRPRPELKMKPDLDTTATPGSTEAFLAINTLAQGTASASRIGNHVCGKYISIKGYCTAHATSVADFVELVVVKDLQATGGYPTWLEVFATDNINSPRTADTALLKRFKILKHKIINLNDAKSLASLITLYIPLKNLRMDYLGNAGDQTDLRGNGVYLMYCSFDDANKATLVFTTRFAFTDP